MGEPRTIAHRQDITRAKDHCTHISEVPTRYNHQRGKGTLHQTASTEDKLTTKPTNPNDRPKPERQVYPSVIRVYSRRPESPLSTTITQAHT